MLKPLTLFICMFMSLTVLSQEPILLQKKITLNLKNASLEEILQAIDNEASVHFSYDSKIADSKKRIDFIVEDQSLKNTLDQLCHIYNLEYRLVRQQIVIKEASPADDTQLVKRFTISGHIRDKESGETLPGATVIIKDTKTGTISNAYGFYSITLPAETYELVFSFVGYEKAHKEIELISDKSIDVELELRTLSLMEVTVEYDKQLEDMKKSQSGYLSLNPSVVKRFPEFAGESDLIRNLQTLPGVQTHSEGSAFFFVRGGNKDQNLILVDEAPIYNPAHLFGFYSVVIPDVAKSINIYKADIPVDKSGRLSSLIDIQTRDGNMKKISAEGLLNPLLYRLSLEGPIVKDKASFYTSYRRSNFNWLYKNETPGADLYFMNLNTKLNWKINDKNRLYFAFFYGKDNYTNKESETDPLTGLQWHNFTSTLRWNHIFNNRLFSNATLYVSDYNYALLTGLDPWQSGISDITFKYDFSYFASPDKTILFGMSLTEHEINAGNMSPEEGEQNTYIPTVTAGKAFNAGVYFSREKRINDKWSWKAGLKIPVWNHKGPFTAYEFDENYNVTDTLFYDERESAKTYINLDWRLSAKYNFNDHSALNASFGNYNQYLHLISNSISPLSSFEIWMPSGQNIKPQKARQLTFGYNQLMSYNFEFSADLFYKKMLNQIEYVNHANLLLNPLLERELRFGESRSYGLEISLRKTKGRLTGWLSYTYSRVYNIFPDLNEGQPYPAFYDRPHDFSIFLSFAITERLNMSANWIYYTGSAVTTPVSFYYYNDNLVPLYGERNNDRLPDYHRLDLSLSLKLSKAQRRFQHSLNLSIYNLYNRHNAVSINFNKVETNDGYIVVPANLYGTHEVLSTQKYMVGIMPSITYRFKF